MQVLVCVTCKYKSVFCACVCLCHVPFSSWCYVRFLVYLICFPCVLAGLCDPRRSAVDKRNILRHFVLASEEKLDVHFVLCCGPNLGL